MDGTMLVRGEWKFEQIPTTHKKLLQNFKFNGELMPMKMEIGTIQKVKMYKTMF